MNQNDINRAFTEKVLELVAQGYQINPATMSGSQGEIGKVDLRKGSDIIRVLLTEGRDYISGPDFLTLTVGRCTDNIRIDCFDRLGNTIWDNRLEIISEIKFAKVAENFFTDMETGRAIAKKRFARCDMRHQRSRRELGEAFKSAALRYVRKQPRMKTCRLEDIESVTRVNKEHFSRVLPDLYGYEIKAKGKTFLLKAPNGSR